MPGDSILFKRGETWREQLTVPSSGTPDHPITFGAYGTGAKPVLNGSDVLMSWSLSTGTTYTKSSVTIEPKIVVYNGTRLTKGAGTELARKSYYYDRVAATLYVNVGENLSTSILEAGNRVYAINITNHSYVNFDYLDLRNTNDAGINFDNASYININACDITQVAYRGTRVAGAFTSQYLNFTNMKVSHAGGTGISIDGDADITGHVLIQNCVVHDCGWNADPVDAVRWTAGIKVWGGANYGSSGESDDVMIENCEVYSQADTHGDYSGGGIWVDQWGTGAVVRRNKIHNNTTYGILLENMNNSALVHNNLVYSNKWGIAVYRNIRNQKIYNNTLYNNSDIGLWCKGDESPGVDYMINNEFKNNIVIGSARELSAVRGGDNKGHGSGNVCEYNCLGPEKANFVEWGSGIYKSTYKTWEAAYGGATHSVEADPLMVNPANDDFHLLPASPCIDAGVDVGLTQDYEGNSIRGLPDIGAFEFSDGTSSLIASATSSPTTGQAPLNVNFTGSATGGNSPYSYSWTFGDGGSSTTQNPSHTYSSAGSYTATLTVTDSLSATASKSLTITVTSAPTQLVATASASPTAGPAPLTASFTASASGGTPPYSYNWDFGDGTSSVSQNPGHVYSTLGDYIVTLTVTDNLSGRANAVINISVVSTTTAVLGISSETGAPAPGQGGTTDPTPGNHSYPIGSAVEVDSIPNTDYRFSKWTGDVLEAGMFNLATTVALDKNKSVLATFCTKCADVNGDLKITPSDAQLAFDLFLGKIGSPTWCELENADVGCSGTKLVPKITPADAQIIFNKYLKKGTDSGDCSGNSRTAVSSQQNTMFSNASLTIDSSFLTSEGDILIPIIIESPSEIGAFGFDLAFPSDNWTYVGLERTDLTNNYDQLAGNVVSYQASGPDQSAAAVPNDQFLRVGGYKTSDDKNASVGVLVTLVFRPKTGFVDPSEISIIAAYDDIQNVSIYAGSSIRLRENERRAENRRPADQRRGKAISRKFDF